MMATSPSTSVLRALRPKDVLCHLPMRNMEKLAMLLRPQRTSDWALAHVLSQAITPGRLSILTTEAAASNLRSVSIANAHGVIPETATSVPDNLAAALPYAASWAVANRVSHLAVADTYASSTLSAITRFDAGIRQAYAGGATSGVEMLPPHALIIHRPLEKYEAAVVDATVPQEFLQFLPSNLDEQQRAEEVINESGSAAQMLTAYIDRRAQSIKYLERNSDAVICDAVVEASHWGYLVVRRSSLLNVYNRGKGGRFVALHAMCRMVMHVSGSNDPLEADDESVARMLHDLMRTDKHGTLKPLPKGRTVSGIVVRPATGRFVKRVVQSERRLGKRSQTRREQPDDMMIITREPDHETGNLYTKRLKGNFSCVPLPSDGTPVYWDNRFVISATPVSQLDKLASPFDATSVIATALYPVPQENFTKNLDSAELYVRQIRQSDWENITSATGKVRNFQVPFECIRSLPAIFQKSSGSNDLGKLVASPHLGLSARPDLYFTAVRMPRFRSLPAEIDPGFSENHFDSLKTGVLGKQPRRRQTIGKTAL